MTRRKRILATLTAAAAALTLAGCSTVSTEPDQIALHYSGGSLSSKTFQACVDASTREVHGPGEKYYAYPTRQVSYDATGSPGAESKPFTVVSKDNAEMRVPVTMTLVLKTDCATLQKFHEAVGNKYRAWWGGSDVLDSNEDGVPEGWVNLLNFGIGKPLDTTLDRAAQGYTWRQLWNDPAAKTAIETQVEQQIGAKIDDQLGGQYFTVQTVLLQKPDPVSDDLKQAVADEQSAVAKANSAKSQADAEVAAANAQIAVAKAQAAQVEEQIRVLGQDGYIKKYAIDKGVTPWPAPVVAGTAAGGK